MTAPVLAPDVALARLTAVAAWDLPPIRGAVGDLATMAARLPFWRMRLGALARALQDAECWSGPAAQNAAAAVLEISTVAAAVDGAIVESLTGLERMAGQADTAQELAQESLRMIPSAGLGAALEFHDRLPELFGRLAPGAPAPEAVPGFHPGDALAIAALEHAGWASDAAGAAGEPAPQPRHIGAGRGRRSDTWVRDGWEPSVNSPRRSISWDRCSRLPFPCRAVRPRLRTGGPTCPWPPSWRSCGRHPRPWERSTGYPRGRGTGPTGSSWRAHSKTLRHRPPRP